MEMQRDYCGNVARKNEKPHWWPHGFTRGGSIMNSHTNGITNNIRQGNKFYNQGKRLNQSVNVNYCGGDSRPELRRGISYRGRGWKMGRGFQLNCRPNLERNKSKEEEQNIDIENSFDPASIRKVHTAIQCSTVNTHKEERIASVITDSRKNFKAENPSGSLNEIKTVLMDIEVKLESRKPVEGSSKNPFLEQIERLGQKEEAKTDKVEIKMEKVEIKMEKEEAKTEKEEIKMEKVEIKMEKEEINMEEEEINMEEEEINMEKKEIKMEKVEIKMEKEEIKVEKVEIKMEKEEINMEKVEDIVAEKEVVKDCSVPKVEMIKKYQPWKIRRAYLQKLEKQTTIPITEEKKAEAGEKRKEEDGTGPKMWKSGPPETVHVAQQKKGGRKQRIPCPTVQVPQFTLNCNTSFDKQACELISQVEQSESDRQNCELVLEDVFKTFRSALPNVEPTIFGSTLTSLAFKTSDLDVYLFCPQGQPSYNFVLKHGRLMFRSKAFHNVGRIAHARVPVMKSTHTATGLSVDVTASSRLGVCNSRLLRLAVTLSDPRVRRLLMLISLFGKVTCMTGPNKLSNYSWSLLTIFYLQVMDSPLLPPLYKLINPIQVGPWPVIFQETSGIFDTNNSMSLSALFIGFFKYYSNFDFSNTIISTFSGSTVPLSAVKDPKRLPPCFSEFKSIVGSMEGFPDNLNIYIQEPLNVSFCPSHSLLPQMFTGFVTTCRVVSQFLENLPEYSWFSQLYSMFNAPVLEERKFHFRLSGKQEDWKKVFKGLEAALIDVFLIKVDRIPSIKQESTEPVWLQCSSRLHPFMMSREKIINHLSELTQLTEFARHSITSRHLSRKVKVNQHMEALVSINFFTAANEVRLQVFNIYNGPADVFKSVVPTLEQNLKQIVDFALADPNLDTSRELAGRLMSGTVPDNINSLKDFLRAKLQSKVQSLDSKGPSNSNQNKSSPGLEINKASSCDVNKKL